MRLSGGLVAGFLVVGAGVRGLYTPTAGRSRLWPLWALSLLGMPVLPQLSCSGPQADAAPFVPGFFVYLLSSRLSRASSRTKPSSSISSHRITRTEAAELLLSALCHALTWRFVGNRPAPTTLLDRLALTFFVLAHAQTMAIPYHWPRSH